MPFALRLPPYGGKFDVDNIEVCAKRGERPIIFIWNQYSLTSSALVPQ